MKMHKNLIAFLLSISLLVSLSVPCLAADKSVITNPSTEVSENQLIQQMESLGFTQEEINTILQLEEARLQKATFRITRSGFPSNPKVGDWYYNTFDIHLSTISLTVAGIAGALISGGVGAAVALVLAQSILNELKEDSGYTKIIVHQSFRYGETNDGVLGWSYGPVTFELV